MARTTHRHAAPRHTEGARVVRPGARGRAGRVRGRRRLHSVQRLQTKEKYFSTQMTTKPLSSPALRRRPAPSRSLTDGPLHGRRPRPRVASRPAGPDPRRRLRPARPAARFFNPAPPVAPRAPDVGDAPGPRGVEQGTASPDRPATTKAESPRVFEEPTFFLGRSEGLKVASNCGRGAGVRGPAPPLGSAPPFTHLSELCVSRRNLPLPKSINRRRFPFCDFTP